MHFSRLLSFCLSVAVLPLALHRGDGAAPPPFIDPEPPRPRPTKRELEINRLTQDRNTLLAKIARIAPQLALGVNSPTFKEHREKIAEIERELKKLLQEPAPGK